MGWKGYGLARPRLSTATFQERNDGADWAMTGRIVCNIDEGYDGRNIHMEGWTFMKNTVESTTGAGTCRRG